METDLLNGQDEAVSDVLCRIEDIPDGESRGFEITVDDEEIELFVVRKGSSVFGYLNDCPHVGTPLNWKNTQFLTMDKSMIICATHGAVFRIEDGHCTAGPCVGMKLKSVSVGCEGTDIVLRERPQPGT